MIQWKVFVAFLIGGSIPFLFSSLLINAVGRAAYYVVNEVRWQFANIKGIWEGTTDPDYGKVVTIVTSAAQKELLTPALLAIISPDRHRLRLRPGGTGRASWPASSWWGS